MSHLKDKVIVITGASAGIGATLARECAALGGNVVLAARRKDRLEKLAAEIAAQGGSALPIQTDVSKESEVKRLISAALKRFGRIDFLVNNAGYGVLAPIADTPGEDARNILDVNFLGMHYACRATIPVMMKQGRGHIINISSVAGILPSPLYGLYCSTKFAMNAYSDILRIELRPHDIAVSVICPGPVETEFTDAAKNLTGERWKQSRSRDFLTQSAEEIVAIIVACMRKPKARVVTSFPLRVAVFLYTLCPRFFQRFVLSRAEREMVEPAK